jgi:hypothetical protein
MSEEKLDLFPNGFDPNRPIPDPDGDNIFVHTPISPLDDNVKNQTFSYVPEVSDEDKVNDYWVVYPHPIKRFTDVFLNAEKFKDCVVGDFMKIKPNKLKVFHNYYFFDFDGDTTNYCSGEYAPVPAQDNVDSTTKNTGIIRKEKLVEWIQTYTNYTPESTGTVCFDFEIPFDDVFFNGVTDARHPQTTNTLADALLYVKLHYPKLDISNYGIPVVLYNLSSTILDKYYKSYIKISRYMDYLTPILYDRNDATWREFQIQRAKNQITLCKKLNSTIRIFPFVSPFSQGSGNIPESQLYSVEDFLDRQIRPAVESKVNGFFVWSSLNYKIWVATLSTLSPSHPTYEIQVQTRSYLKQLFNFADPSNWADSTFKTQLKIDGGNLLSKYHNAILGV